MGLEAAVGPVGGPRLALQAAGGALSIEMDPATGVIVAVLGSRFLDDPQRAPAVGRRRTRRGARVGAAARVRGPLVTAGSAFGRPLRDLLGRTRFPSGAAATARVAAPGGGRPRPAGLERGRPARSRLDRRHDRPLVRTGPRRRAGRAGRPRLGDPHGHRRSGAGHGPRQLDRQPRRPERGSRSWSRRSAASSATRGTPGATAPDGGGLRGGCADPGSCCAARVARGTGDPASYQPRVDRPRAWVRWRHPNRRGRARAGARPADRGRSWSRAGGRHRAPQ